jgi:tetratricopeptide (TPR) repeat protein
MGRMERAPDLRVDDPRLAQMQGRLAMLLTTVAGGSGLQARTAFDRTRTEPLLEKATGALAAKRFEEAEALLAEAAEIEPGDPRVPLARADVAEARGDLRAALRGLRRAYEIDPAVPLVQLRLGDVLRRLGSRGEAAFYLEQAAANLRAGSSLQKRAEEVLRNLPFPTLTASRLSALSAVYRPGETVAWDGELGPRFVDEPVKARWIAPDGTLHREDPLQPARGGAVRAALETGALATGDWTLEVDVGDVLADQVRFALRTAAQTPAAPAANP